MMTNKVITEVAMTISTASLLYCQCFLTKKTQMNAPDFSSHVTQILVIFTLLLLSTML